MRRRIFVLALVVIFASIVNAPASAYWPQFRGPNGNGIVETSGLPLTWSETDNIVWSTEMPHRGWSSPVVLDGQIWLTTATVEGTEYFAVCVDPKTGEIVYNERLFQTDSPEPLGNNVNTYASPTPVIEPGRVYVHFGSYGTACIDTQTKETLWTRTDLECRHYRGPGSSAILHENLLILTFDGVDVQYLAALDKTTGETVWRTERTTEWTDLDEHGEPLLDGDYRKAYSTPLVVETPVGTQLLTVGSSAAFAYEPATGNEIWKTSNDAFTPAARPVYSDGIAYLTTGRGKSELWAVRVDGRGDVSDTHVVWKLDGRSVPDDPSPVLMDGYLYTVSGRGIASCIDAATGEIVWSELIGGNYEASPIFADGRIYFFSVQGNTTVVKAGPEYELLATQRLCSGFMASPAVDGTALILRSKTHLYRIEN